MLFCIALIAALQTFSLQVTWTNFLMVSLEVAPKTGQSLLISRLEFEKIKIIYQTIKELKPPDFIHGKDGLGKTNQPGPKISYQQKSAAK